MHKPFPGHPCDAERDYQLIAEHISNCATHRCCAFHPGLNAIQPITNDRGNQQPESDLKLKWGKEKKTEAKENRREREHIRAYSRRKRTIAIGVRSRWRIFCHGPRNHSSTSL